MGFIVKLMAVFALAFALGCFLLTEIPPTVIRRAVEEAASLILPQEAEKAAESIDNATLDALLFFTIGFAAAFLLCIFVTAVSLRKLNRLKRSVGSLSGGNYGTRVPVTGKDEIGGIATLFNDMSDSMERSIANMKAVGEAYSRFVPDEMLTILQRDSITDINTTDYASIEASFLLLTTESFDSYRDEAYLDAVNDFYTCILPVLSGGGALVERFTANELRALFDCAPVAALNTALNLFNALNRLNAEFEKSGQKPVECGVLLSFSESFLGIAGYSKRLNIILQSRYSYKVDSVREIGIRYSCRLLLEQRAFEGLGTAVSRYRHRLLGYILDRGERCAVYDFYDGEPVEAVHCKDITRERFTEAVGLYYNAQYDKARSAFIEIIGQTPNDLAAREYLKKSHLRFGTNTPPDYLFEV